MRSRSAFAILLLAVTTVGPAVRTNGTDTRLLAQPAVSATHVAFSMPGDLWSARLDGTDIRRLTTSEGPVSNPAFSPDGKTLAFSANYNGNTDVFVVPVEGGAADAAHLASRAGSGPGLHAGRQAGPLHLAARGLHRPLHAALHRGQGRRRRDAAADPERGARRVFDRRPPDRLQPAGAGVPAVEALSRRAGLDDQHLRRRRPRPCRRSRSRRSRANDVDPMWVGDTLYFRSDRDGEFNLYAFDAKVAAVRQITRHADFPVLNAAAGGGHIVYEQAGYLHLLDPATGKSRQLTFSVFRRISARRASASSAARSGSGPRRCRRPAPAPSSTSAATSSRSRRRRATSAI